MKVISCVLVLLVANLYSVTAQNRVRIAVYYESLCGDCIRYVINQLNPAYKKLSNYMDIVFVPYGKASQQLENGEWVFQCQHGPDECHGNLIQACALRETNDTNKQMDYVNCIMSKSPSSDAYGERCAVDSGLSWKAIKSCVYSTTGTNLLAHYGDLTHAVRPQITFIPTIIYNGVYNADLQNDSLQDMIGTVCKLIVGEKPPVCTSSLNRQHFWSTFFKN